MARRRSKDKHLATKTAKQIVKKEPASPSEIANCFTPLGTIPRPNYSFVLASSYDPYALTLVNQPIKTTFPKNPNASQYISKQYRQNLFSIEPNRAFITDPLKFATSFFPPNFHWNPEHIGKDLGYFYAILTHENSILIKSIIDKTDATKIIYHNVTLLHIITEEKWGQNPISFKMLPTSHIPYSSHDYTIAWFRFMLHQDSNMTHSWFVSFDKNFNAQLPLWFS